MSKKDDPLDESIESTESIEPLKQESVPTALETLHNPSGAKDKVEKIFAQAINLGDNSVLYEPTCILCSSQFREEIEQNFLKNKNFAEAQKLFKDKSGLNIAKSVIENHMSFHYDEAIKEIQKVEYANRIKRLSSNNLTTMDRIATSYAIITERLMGVNSIVPTTEESITEVEKIKSVETARQMGVLTNLLKLQASILGEMKNNGEIVNIPTDEFAKVFTDAFSEVKTDKEREIVKNIMYRLEALSIKSQ